MQIRTRDPDGGLLMHNNGSEEGRFSLLEVVPYDIDGEGESELIVTYTLGYKDQSSPVLQLTGVNVGNGQWHNISVVRERTHVTLSVDSDGDGYSVTEHLGAEHSLFIIDPTRTYIGGAPPSSTSRYRRANIGKDFVGCINDVRFNGHLLYYYNGTNALGNARSVGVSEGCLAEPMCEPNPCNISEWCRDVWRKFVCLPRLCTTQPCKNGGTCFEGADSRGNNKFFCKCPLGFEGALCDVRGRSVVVPEVTGARVEDGLIIGLAILVVTLILSACITFVYLRRSRPKKHDVFDEEDQFKRDNVANYRIEGGGEMDLEEEDQVRDILRSFETNDFSPCLNKTFKISGSNGDVSGPYVVLTALKRDVDGRQPSGVPGSNPLQRPVKLDKQAVQRSYSQEGSDQEPPDSSSSPSAVSTPERRRRVRTSSKGEERHSPEGGEEGVEGSPTRKLTEVFGLSEEEQERMRSPPEGFSSPEKYQSLSKRERGNGASLQRPNKMEEESRKPPQCVEELPLSHNGVESFAMENPLSRPSSDLHSSAIEDGFSPVYRNSIPPRKPPRACFPRGMPPPPGNFIPEDLMQRFCYEGAGSPTISLSTLGDTEGESEAGDNFECVNQMGEKFKKLARIYGQTHSVTFSPHDEVIGE
ncbi:protocadherin Fat 4-like [Stylophora pistillata]|nr:protocadherin Fat 4-like [Stylophora pistillata]